MPQEYQHEVLFWGVVGALIMRAIFIAAGVTLLNRFHWIIYIFGAILIYSGIKLMRQHGAEIHPEKNPVLRVLSQALPRDQGLRRRLVFRDASAACGTQRRWPWY